VRHRGSVSSRITSLQRAETGNTVNTRLRSNSSLEGDEEENGISHPVEPRARIPMLPPVLNKVVDVDPACWLDFTEDAIITSCGKGRTCGLHTWKEDIRANVEQGTSGHGTGPEGRLLELTAQSQHKVGGRGFICQHLSFSRSALSVSSQMFVYNSFVYSLSYPRASSLHITSNLCSNLLGAAYRGVPRCSICEKLGCRDVGRWVASERAKRGI
jgi:hypothetical protein